MLGPIDDTDRTNWQRNAVRVLGDVLTEAVKVGLPCVHWELGSGQTLVVRCLHSSDVQRRAAFLAWAGYFAIADRKEWDSAGVTHLHASRTDFRGCTIVIVAILYQEPTGAGERS